MNKWANEANEIVMNESLLKCFLYRTLMNEWGTLGWKLFMNKDVVSINNLNITKTFRMNE